eukprot:scaffold92278_cov62-Phaeocystis_antarctica.AAC.7
MLRGWFAQPSQDAELLSERHDTISFFVEPANAMYCAQLLPQLQALRSETTLTTYHSLLTTYYVLLTTHCLLLLTEQALLSKTKDVGNVRASFARGGQQPYASQAATLCISGCNPMRPRRALRGAGCSSPTTSTRCQPQCARSRCVGQGDGLQPYAPLACNPMCPACNPRCATA